MSVLTKSLLLAGHICPKSLWMKVNGPPQKLRNELTVRMGNRLNKYLPKVFGDGVDLSHIKDMDQAVDETMDLLADPSVNVIYEAAFQSHGALVRADVLKRVCDEVWSLYEVKSASKSKPIHYMDACIQKMVIDKMDVIEIDKVFISLINSDFIYDGQSYDGLLHSERIPNDTVESLVTEAETLLDRCKEVVKEPACPKVTVGKHCTDPYVCSFQAECDPPYETETPISIIPRVGKRLAKKWASHGVYDLTDLPREELTNPLYLRMWDVHKTKTPWKSTGDILVGTPWPRYFVDFEFVRQVVPIVKHTKPMDTLPFQWSVHRWDSLEHIPSLQDTISFIQYDDPEIHRNFLSSLIDVLGTEGPIYAHNVSTERSVLKKVVSKDCCKDLKPQVEAIINRLEDTIPLTKALFYSPEMMGSYSLKSIVKAIPTTVEYGEEGVADGSDAASHWFDCTEEDITLEEKKHHTEALVRYCAKDTLALVDLIRFLQSS